MLAFSMTDDSNIVKIRWEIDNATATLATGKAESAEFNEGGVRWVAAIERRPPHSEINFSLRCDSNSSEFWKCMADVGVHIQDANGRFECAMQRHFRLDKYWMTRCALPWRFLEKHITGEDKVIIKLRILIIGSYRSQPIAVSNKFSAPNDRSDVILKIGDEKLHVSKELLAIHSPVFEAMFFGEFVEKGKDEIELKDIVYEEFLDLLQLIYPHDATVKITGRTVQHILKLADRFQIELGFRECYDCKFNRRKNMFRRTLSPYLKKLLLADRYRFTSLRDHCLHSFRTVADLHANLKSSPEFANFSGELKIAICERTMQLELHMTDDSNILKLRWEINNATETFTTGRAESAEFNEGGFRWTAAVERHTERAFHETEFALQCAVDNNMQWKCEADVGVYVLQSNGAFLHWIQDIFCFERDSSRWHHYCTGWNALFISPGYRIGNTVTIEFRIRISSSEKSEPIAIPSKFSAPNNMCNVILKIGDEKMHVSKELLAIHSPVFEAMFFGEFAEKGMEEIELKDVVCEEFLDLLQLIYPHGSSIKITDRTVQHILMLADRFQIENVIDLSVDHLKLSNGFDAANKLLLADQYRLSSLRDHCLNSFKSVDELHVKLKSSPEFANFSEGMQAAICRKMMQLELQ